MLILPLPFISSRGQGLPTDTPKFQPGQVEATSLSLTSCEGRQIHSKNPETSPPGEKRKKKKPVPSLLVRVQNVGFGSCKFGSNTLNCTFGLPLGQRNARSSIGGSWILIHQPCPCRRFSGHLRMWDVLRFANHQVDEECQNNTVPVSGQITIIHKRIWGDSIWGDLGWGHYTLPSSMKQPCSKKCKVHMSAENSAGKLHKGRPSNHPQFVDLRNTKKTACFDPKKRGQQTKLLCAKPIWVKKKNSDE